MPNLPSPYPIDNIRIHPDKKDTLTLSVRTFIFFFSKLKNIKIKSKYSCFDLEKNLSVYFNKRESKFSLILFLQNDLISTLFY